MKKLFLHVGYPKTGTTGLQKFLQDNDEALASGGLLYPRTGRLNGAHYVLNFSLGIGIYDGPENIPDAETLNLAMRREIESSPCESVLISSEYFITAKAVQKVKDFFADYDVKILIYLRRHDFAFESGFAQGEKTTSNPPWEPDVASFALHALCSDNVPFDYLLVLRRWAGVFGKENIIVRPFEKQQNQPDLFGDFLGAIGVTDSPDFKRPGTMNSSLSRETLMALRLVGKSDLPPGVKEKLIGRIHVTNGTGASERYFSPAMRRVVVSKYLPTYGVIAKEFMGREDGVLFTDPLPKANDLWQAPANPRQEDIVDRLLKVIGPLI